MIGNLEQAQGHWVKPQSGVQLLKRTPPEQESIPHRVDNQVAIRKQLLEDWDELEHSHVSKKRKDEQRRKILKRLIKTVPYHADRKKEYASSIHQLLGDQRVSNHRNQIHSSITISVPEWDRPDFAKIWRQGRDRRSDLQKKMQNKYGQTSEQHTVGLPDWDDLYTLDDAEQLAATFEDLESPEMKLKRQRDSLLREWDELDQSTLSTKQVAQRRKNVLKRLLDTVPLDPNNPSGHVKTVHDIFGEERMKQHAYQINRSIPQNIPETQKEEREKLKRVLHNLRNRRNLRKMPSLTESTSPRYDDHEHSHLQMALHEQEHQSQFYGYLHNSEVGDTLHEQPYPSQDNIYWPQHTLLPTSIDRQSASFSPSIHYHDDFHGFDNAMDVASMFHNSPSPSSHHNDH